MTKIETLILFISIAWAGLQFGTLWIMTTSILPLINSREKEAYIDTCQGIDMHFFHKVALTGGIAFMAAGAYLTTQLADSTAQIATAVATLGMIGVGLISEGSNRPIWRRIEVWNYNDIATNWVELRHFWGRAHQLRTVSAFFALVGFTVAAAVSFT